MSEKQNASQCAGLKAFRDFLASSCNSTSHNESVVVSRQTLDNYAVTAQELQAEIKTHLWSSLLANKCPASFRIKLIQAVLEECLNSKELDFNCVTAQTTDVENSAATTPPNELKYDLGKLQKYVLNILETLLNKLADNAQQSNLLDYCEDAALCCQEQAEQTCNCKLPSTDPMHVVGYIKNKPRKMEDRHICMDKYSQLYNISDKRFALYAVLDGHSGALAATYAAAQLPAVLAQNLLKYNRQQLDVNQVETYCEAMELAFLKTDQQFGEKNLNSGTTAVLALLAYDTASQLPQHLFVAWVGDSQALLVSPTSHLQLVKPHKPNSSQEKQRIELAGGSVMHIQGQWRVNGILNVARSIGDSSVSAVIAEPDFVDVPLHAAHDFLVLGSDGLWDHVADNVVANSIYEALSDDAQTLDSISKRLIDMAKAGDSQDNITVLIVLFKQRQHIVQHYQKQQEQQQND